MEFCSGEWLDVASVVFTMLVLGLLIYFIPRNPQTNLRRITLPVVSPKGDDRLELRLEVAATAKQQRIGLMFRSAVPDLTGMLFRWPKPMRSVIWMRNVRVPLDLVFMDDRGRIISIVTRKPGGLMMSGWNFKSAMLIELAGGCCRRHGIKVGWSVDSREKERRRLDVAPLKESGASVAVGLTDGCT